MKLTKSQANELDYYEDRLNNLTWVRLAIYMFEEILRRIPEREDHHVVFCSGICNAFMCLEEELIAGHINDGHRRLHILRRLGRAYTLITVLAMNWEHTLHPDRNVCYPVPSVFPYTRWEGPNLEMRISLINHCLTYLRYQRSILEQGS